MSGVILWSRVLVIGGLAGMLVGALDPLEGSLIILPGVGVTALGAFVGRSRHRFLIYRAFVLAAIGVGALWVMSAYGGIGGPGGHSMWWGLTLLPYPAGWIMGLVGAILFLVETFKRPARHARAA